MCLMSYANNKGADQPAHPRSLISTVVVCCLDSIIFLDSIAEISRLYLASVAVQAGLCLAWSETPEDTFCRVVAQTEPKHDRTNKITWAPSEDTGQPGNPPSLTEMFVLVLKTVWFLSPIKRPALIRLGGCPD